MHNSDEVRDEVDGIVAAWGRERTDFNPEPLSVFSRLLRLDRHIDRMRRQTFATYGIESWEFEMLAALRRQGKPYRLTAGRLVQETLVSSGTVTNRIDRMVTHGYAERHPDPKDRRVVHVQATQRGVDLVDAAMSDLRDAEQRQLEDMPVRNQKELADLLRQLLAHFEREA